MNKREIQREIAMNTGISQEKVGIVLDEYAKLLIDYIFNYGESVNLPGVGTFKSRCVHPKKGKSAITGSEWRSDGGSKIVFQALPSIKKIGIKGKD